MPLVGLHKLVVLRMLVVVDMSVVVHMLVVVHKIARQLSCRCGLCHCCKLMHHGS